MLSALKELLWDDFDDYKSNCHICSCLAIDCNTHSD